MAEPPPASAGRSFWPIINPAAVALTYALAHLVWHGTKPLGQVPARAEQANPAFAEAIQRGPARRPAP